MVKIWMVSVCMYMMETTWLLPFSSLFWEAAPAMEASVAVEGWNNQSLIISTVRNFIPSGDPSNPIHPMYSTFFGSAGCLKPCHPSSSLKINSWWWYWWWWWSPPMLIFKEMGNIYLQFLPPCSPPRKSQSLQSLSRRREFGATWTNSMDWIPYGYATWI